MRPSKFQANSLVDDDVRKLFQIYEYYNLTCANRFVIIESVEGVLHYIMLYERVSYQLTSWDKNKLYYYKEKYFEMNSACRTELSRLTIVYIK